MRCKVCVELPTRVTCNFDSDKLDDNVLLSDVSDHHSTLTKVAGLLKKSKNISDVYVLYF